MALVPQHMASVPLKMKYCRGQSGRALKITKFKAWLPVCLVYMEGSGETCEATLWKGNLRTHETINAFIKNIKKSSPIPRTNLYEIIWKIVLFIILTIPQIL